MTFSDETFFKAVRGDSRAMKATLEQYTPLVHKWVRKYSFMGQSHSYEDLVQEGMIGIVEAVRTFDLDRLTAEGKTIKPMTWIWWKVRGAVQTAAKKEKKNPKYALSLEQSDWGNNLEDENIFEVKDEKLPMTLEEIVRAGCGGTLDSVRAKIVKDRFGILGCKEMAQGEVAKKYGLSKQATNGHISRFTKAVRSQHPELKEYI